jgi:CRP-like cAMP-binding protein
VVLTDQNGSPSTVVPPAALGLEEALQGIPAASGARAGDLVVTLAIPVEELRTLLADNTDLVRGLFATLAHASDGQTWPAVIPTGAATEFLQLAAGGLTAVEKVLALQHVPLFTRIEAADMLALAGITRTQSITSGTRLFEASAPPALWVILSGEVQLDQAGGSPIAVEPGSVIGMNALLTGSPMGAAADGTRPGVALRIDREDLFDLVEQRPALLQQLFVTLFRGVDVERAVA